MDLSRRELLVAAGLGLVGYASLGGGDTPPLAPLLESGTRTEPLRPVAGGSAVSVEESDGFGTLGGGVEGPEGENLVVTSRHVVDPDYPDGDDEDVLGRSVYQPDEGTDPIGEVVDVGPTKGSGATDWAVVEIEEAEEWSAHVLGIGEPLEAGEAEIGDRIVMSGLSTGLVGGEITDTGVSTNWRGTLLDGVVEYRIDDDLDTAGNSGSWVGSLSSEGFRPVGIHTFRDDGARYAIPVSDVLEGAGVELTSEGERPEAPGVGSFVEGSVLEWSDNSVSAVTANVGGDTVEEREIEVLDEEGETIDSELVTLDPLELELLEMDSAGRPTISTGDVERSAVDLR